MFVDVNFDYRSDAAGKDPDIFSETLKRHHQILWSKQLPNGDDLNLELDPKNYLKHKSAQGELQFSSDTISNSLRHQKRMAHIISQVPNEQLDAFQALGATVGAVTVFPGKKIDGQLTINVSRGFLANIGDRFDLTLECIRRFYAGEQSPLFETLRRYESFFDLFVDFERYVEFFHFQDLVDGRNIKFFIPFDGQFVGGANPKTIDDYFEYMHSTMNFVEARRLRIGQIMAEQIRK